MASKYWIKLYHEILHDPKMGRLSDKLWRRCIELFLLAGEFDQNGALPPPDEICWTLRITMEECNESLHELQRLNVAHCNDDATWVITHFSERQDASTSTERSRALRERNRQEKQLNPPREARKTSNNCATETQQNVAPDTDTDTESLPKGNGEKSPTPPAESIPKTEKPGKKQPLKQSGKPKEPPPPAVEVYHGTASRFPHKATWEDIVKRVGDNPTELERWRDTIRAYIGCGWNPNNVKGMLGYFERREIPGQDYEKARQNGNGTTPGQIRPRAPVTPAQPIPRDESFYDAIRSKND